MDLELEQRAFFFYGAQTTCPGTVCVTVVWTPSELTNKLPIVGHFPISLLDSALAYSCDTPRTKPTPIAPQRTL